MPRLVHRSPKYRKHRASGQAIVSIDGRDIYLGLFGSKASRNEYDRVIGEWLANGRRSATAAASEFTVKELIAAFWQHAEKHYRGPDGTTTSELDNYRVVLRHLKRLYGETPAADFGPLALKALRNEFVRLGWCRSNINKKVNRVRHVFRWGVAEELVPPSVVNSLEALQGLQRGRSEVRESEPVKPVSDQQVEAVLPHVSRQVGAMIQLQRLTGARPAEICGMTTGAIDRSGKVWAFRPALHKNSHRGHDRVIFLGPRAQEVVTPFLKLDPAAPIFSPVEAELERRARQHAARRTPLNQGNSPGTNRKRRGRKPAGRRYSVDSYRRAIARACDDAFPPPEHLRPRASIVDGKERRETQAEFEARLTAEEKAELALWRREHSWHPHQLRHSAATQLRREYGLEVAQVILGHRTLAATQIYAERDIAAAAKVMAEVG